MTSHRPLPGTGRQPLARASIPGPLSVLHFIFGVMNLNMGGCNGHGWERVHEHGTGYCCHVRVLVCVSKANS